MRLEAAKRGETTSSNAPRENSYQERIRISEKTRIEKRKR